MSCKFKLPAMSRERERQKQGQGHYLAGYSLSLVWEMLAGYLSLCLDFFFFLTLKHVLAEILVSMHRLTGY